MTEKVGDGWEEFGVGWCNRCGLEHVGGSTWKCGECGAVLCDLQVKKWPHDFGEGEFSPNEYVMVHSIYKGGIFRSRNGGVCGRCDIIDDKRPTIDVDLVELPAPKNPRKLKATWTFEPAEELEVVYGLIPEHDDPEPVLEHDE